MWTRLTFDPSKVKIGLYIYVGDLLIVCTYLTTANDPLEFVRRSTYNKQSHSYFEFYLDDVYLYFFLFPTFISSLIQTERVPGQSLQFLFCLPKCKLGMLIQHINYNHRIHYYCSFNTFIFFWKMKTTTMVTNSLQFYYHVMKLFMYKTCSIRILFLH